MSDVLGRDRNAAESKLQRAISANQAAYAALKNALWAGQDLVWGNCQAQPGMGPTPAEAVALLGASAREWFAVSALATQIIGRIDGTAMPIMPDGWRYVEHPDGTVAVELAEE